MVSDNIILLAKNGEEPIFLYPKMANRHGLIAGATGTGKTITLKVLAESFSDMGVPVFLADVKGDLTGMCEPGKNSGSVQERIERFCLEGFELKNYPTRFWDVYGEQGHPVRVTISELGPTFLSRLLNLTEVQEGVLNIAFKVADDNGLPLLDYKDLRAMLAFVGEHRAEYTTTYGNVSTQSIGAVQRALLAFENEGGTAFFGEPALDIRDFIRTATDGRGYINILNSVKLSQKPLTYSTFLLWMLSELFEKLPEVGDLDKPRFVFFFDEAHMLFSDAPKALLQKIVQVVKLIRSKGVGVYFITQSPADVPDEVLAQLGNKVQHALRAYTPSEMKAVTVAANSFRPNPAFKTADVIMEMGTGEALVSVLDEKGVPTVVERAFILPPQSKIGPAETATVEKIILADEFELKYREAVDSRSAYEIIQEANEAIAAAQAELDEAKTAEKEEKDAKKAASKTSSSKKTAGAKAVTSVTNSVTNSLSTNLVNSVMGGKTNSVGNIAKKAAKSGVNSLLKSAVRGLFGNLK